MPWLKCPSGCFIEVESDVFHSLQLTAEIVPEKTMRCSQCHRSFRFTAFIADSSGRATRTVDTAIHRIRQTPAPSTGLADNKTLVIERLSRLLGQRAGLSGRFAEMLGISSNLYSPSRLSSLYQGLVQLLINAEVTTNIPTPRIFGLIANKTYKNYWHFAKAEWLAPDNSSKEARYARERQEGEQQWFGKLSPYLLSSGTPDPITRPVYLALNPGCLKQGAAPMYGQSYIVYNNSVKLRSTFTASDTLQLLKASAMRQPSERAGCDENLVFVYQNLHEILLHVTDRQLRYLCSLAGGPPASNPNEFIEVQSWGKIDLGRDVEAIVISKNDLEQMCYETKTDPALIPEEMIDLSAVERGQKICRMFSKLVRFCRTSNIKLFLLPLSGQTMNSSEPRGSAGRITCAGYWSGGYGVDASES